MKPIPSLVISLISLFGYQIQAQNQPQNQPQIQPMTLVECISMALEKNITIKQSELSYQDAEINIRDAQGNFFPSVNAQANHSWNIGLNQDITSGLLENQTTQFTSMGASLNVDLYNGLRNINQLHRATLALLASEYQLEDMKFGRL